MLRAAVVGLGWWGRHIVKCLDGSDRIELVRGVDLDPGAAREFADTNGLTLGDSYDDVLAATDVDAVILATPHGLHEEQVLAAANANKQIFCEKPLTLTGAAAERMLAACDAKGIVIGIGHERRYEAALEELKRMADSGELGTLLHIEINASYRLFAGTAGAGGKDWRHDPKHTPAGTFTAQGVHLTDYIQTVAGPVAEVDARLSRRSRDFPGEDVLAVRITFESGVGGFISTLATTPFYQHVSVFGDRGWAETREVSNVDKPEPSLLTWRGVDEVIHTRSYDKADTVRANLHAWADAVAGKGAYRFTRREKLHNAQILEAIALSAAAGEPRPVGE